MPDSDLQVTKIIQVVELVFVDDTSVSLSKQNNAPSDLTPDNYDKYITDNPQPTIFQQERN